MTTVNDRVIYEGRLITLAVETARLPNGRNLSLEIVRHPGGAVVVAINAEHQVCLLRQYRHAVNARQLWELPAGCVDAGDTSPLATAQRELKEEAGVSAQTWTELGQALPSPGFCNEVLYVFLARNLTATGNQQQDDEIIEIHWVPFATAVNMAATGEICDAKSVLALFRAHWLLTGDSILFDAGTNAPNM